jgi:hypothetical protein
VTFDSKYYYEPRLEFDDGYGANPYFKPQEVSDPMEANLEGSLRPNGTHLVQIDLDCAHEYRPSSTPGHGHLIIQASLTWKEYEKLLEALRNARIVGGENYENAKRHKQTFLRPPWIKKGNLNPPKSLLDELTALKQVKFT